MAKAELTAEKRPACEVAVRLSTARAARQATHEYQGSIEVLVVLLDVVHIILCRLPLVYCIEIEPGVVSLDGLEECSESVLKTGTRQSAVQAAKCIYTEYLPLRVDLQRR